MVKILLIEDEPARVKVAKEQIMSELPAGWELLIEHSYRIFTFRNIRKDGARSHFPSLMRKSEISGVLTDFLFPDTIGSPDN